MPKIKLTIAICTFNRAEYLKETLSDLAVQSADNDLFEILIINNNSTDQTENVCRQFDRMHPELNFRWTTETEQGLSAARNRAIKKAGADHILYIDDDVHLPKNFVQRALNCLANLPELKAGGGRIFVTFDETNPDWIPSELMPMFGLHDLGEHYRFYPRDNFPRGGNMLIHKQVVERIGLFDPKLGRSGEIMIGSEEKAFFERARTNGFSLHYLPELLLYHRIGPNRLKRDYLENQSIGIGQSERRRLAGQPLKLAGKLLSELFKLAGSVFLAAGYLAQGKTKAAHFILIFRIWVLKGFLSEKL